MAQKLKAVLFLGSVREGRNAERVGAFLKNVVQGKFDLKVFDPKKLAFPLLQQPIHFYPDPSKAPKELIEANEHLKQADAVIFVTGEYNRTAQPALLNLIDHFGVPSYAWKAALTVSYSPSPLGGTSAGQSLLPVGRELGLHFIPSSLTIPSVDKALSADGKVQSGFQFLQSVADLSADQLLWLANALKKARSEQKPPKAQPYL